ncbi:MAG: type I-B CRISPR-associated protein Cas7/Csh2 [Candidatus Altiarchaeum hamiconexum]|uniref:Type I-B CRISPR-associated protein Cas7/Csh2 n=1 Tax=Candidatus Altarchaeum hamiconexum TaxID=1803513 RepID=A0A8J8CFT8_9ARCH|nr:type I-B CRISPR-associated protein Cas7/Csh2 [Candidatus Altarchaeum hamiconexum]OIQ06376.1 MAG: type I-B CRISPR-associated protein Cas7/Csh2 [Candidatus Altarchaeum sp. CG2_30_32_3053]PIN67216.1 MAG: type I-B CRISPR-associated protein Cas7/Csh2 [Candidatus Altarchaeum sp. CG12_big_fil_rev_8_21_14_0_65_33_22]PIV27986.1 MAG: type I-B CRISPR-associated protein Cas7/Csh2 [Candidatus Altarchaeum sp. CG03_land_8_20_14_0_80_32_618]PIZ30511.1 MAG: type I-B CRISPR-associated protein Cas7/Csh2 [Candi
MIKNRAEIVFLYDVKDANPNGDPLDENKPRIDEETGINIVTDVRLKRTIRDYLKDFKGYDGKTNKDIFVREIANEKGEIQDGKTRAKDFEENKKIVLEKCIDVRLFGAVIPLAEKAKKKKENDAEKAEEGSKERSITYTGPVQFRMGRSLHKVEMKHIKGTGAFASKEGSTQKTFREEDFLPYSLISFYGIINENAAKHTQLTEEDVNLLLDGMWNGTKNLISRSKAGQMPRLLLKVNYKENNYHIGDLDKMIKLMSEKNEEQIRDISEVTLDASELIETLNKNKGKIASIEFKVDDRVKIDLSDLDKNIVKKEILL